MRKAAEQSIHPKHVLLAQEPESAALYCMNLPPEQRELMNNFGEKGDKFVVVDLGGGTVDLLAIEVLDDGNVKEICPGSGDRIGGQDVNNAFFQSLKDVIEGKTWDQITMNVVEDMLQMEMDFENQKVQIGSSNPDDEEIRLKIPSKMQDMIKKGQISIKADAEKSGYFKIDKYYFKFKSKLIRDKLFDQTIKLILKSIQNILINTELKDLKTMVLVGGFAESKIVVEKIRDLLTDNFPDIKVVIPTSPFRAVLMGAVLYGHDPLIFRSRISRATYGICINTPFNPNKHDSNKKWRNKDDDIDYCKDIFDIHVRKGQSVRLMDKQPSKIYRPIYKNQVEINIPIYSSADREPMYTTDDGCEKVGNITVDIQDTKGGTERKVKVEMIYGGTELGVIATDEQTGKEISFTYNL